MSTTQLQPAPPTGEHGIAPMQNTTTPAITKAGSRTSILPTLRAEWIKIWSLRSNWIVAGLSLVIGGLVAWAFATYSDGPVTSYELTTTGATLITVLAIIVGVLTHTSEEQHGTLSNTLQGQPSRSNLVVAKTAAAATLGAIIGVLGMIGATIGAVIAGEGLGDIMTDGVFESGWAIGITTLAAVLGLGLGLIVRHSAAAISGVMAWWLVIEFLLVAIVPDRYARLLPFQAGYGTMDQQGYDYEELTLTTTQNGLLFAAYAFGFVLIGAMFLNRRDI